MTGTNKLLESMLSCSEADFTLVVINVYVGQFQFNDPDLTINKYHHLAPFLQLKIEFIFLFLTRKTCKETTGSFTHTT
jgi:hypothetical protein